MIFHSLDENGLGSMSSERTFWAVRILVFGDRFIHCFFFFFCYFPPCRTNEKCDGLMSVATNGTGLARQKGCCYNIVVCVCIFTGDYVTSGLRTMGKVLDEFSWYMIRLTIGHISKMYIILSRLPIPARHRSRIYYTPYLVQCTEVLRIFTVNNIYKTTDIVAGYVDNVMRTRKPSVWYKRSKQRVS